MVESAILMFAAATALAATALAKTFFAASACRAELADELVRMANRDETIVSAIGMSVRRTGAATGSVQNTKDGIRAFLAIPIAGLDGRGLLYVNGLRTTGRWWFASVSLHVSDRQLLLGPAPGAGGRGDEQFAR